jgi:putative IMPACT (imprinted ancient) family translation regulator
VRWYGGVKLGTGGLARAYRETAAETLRHAKLLDRYIYTRIRVLVPFESLSTIYRMVDPPNVVLVEEQYGEENVFVFDVRTSVAGTFQKQLTERRLLTLP